MTEQPSGARIVTAWNQPRAEHNHPDEHWIHPADECPGCALFHAEVAAEPRKRGAKVTDAKGVTWQRGNRLWHAYGTDLGRYAWSQLVEARGPITLPEVDQ